MNKKSNKESVLKKLVSIMLLSLLFLNLFSLKVFANIDYSNGAVKEEINENVQTEQEEVKRSYLVSNIDDYIKGTVITSGKVVLTPITITLDFVVNPENICWILFAPAIFLMSVEEVCFIPLNILYNICHGNFSEDYFSECYILSAVFKYFKSQPITDYVWSNW